MPKKKKHMLSPREAMDILGFKYRVYLTRLQERGEIEFEKNEKGVAMFSRAQVEALAEKRGRIVVRRTEDGLGVVAPTAVARKAFALFGQGMTWQNVFLELGKDPRTEQSIATVQGLYAQFMDRPSRVAPRARPLPEKAQEGEVEAPVDDGVAAWKRELDEITKRSDEEIAREQRAWEEQQLKLHGERAAPALRRPTLTLSPLPDPAPEDDSEFARVLRRLRGGQR